MKVAVTLRWVGYNRESKDGRSGNLWAFADLNGNLIPGEPTFTSQRHAKLHAWGKGWTVRAR